MAVNGCDANCVHGRLHGPYTGMGRKQHVHGRLHGLCTRVHGRVQVVYMGCKHSHVHGTWPCIRPYTVVSVNMAVYTAMYVAVYTSGKTAVDGPT